MMEWVIWAAGPAHVQLSDGRYTDVDDDDELLIEPVEGGIVIHDHKPKTVH